MSAGKIRLLTVGRLASQKGYDIAVEACRILKERGVDCTWYVLGKGPLENDVRGLISKYSLEGSFVLLGTRPNPYPYFRMADIYVQTSRHEGFGLAIAEARILNIPVVTTEFDSVYQQMKNGENGLVVGMNAVSVADGIERLITDRGLYQHIKDFLKLEKHDDYQELDKFYALIRPES